MSCKKDLTEKKQENYEYSKCKNEEVIGTEQKYDNEECNIVGTGNSLIQSL